MAKMMMMMTILLLLLLLLLLLIIIIINPGRNISVGIATRYGLDGPGIEFRCRRD